MGDRELDSEQIVAHLTEIMAGECAIDIDRLQTEGWSTESLEILTGLRFLFDDLAYRDGQRAQAEDEIRQSAAMLADQNTQLEASQNEMAELVEQLSTVVIKISHRVIMMPVIGGIDVRRASRMTERLLEGIVREKARYVILDITGVPHIDTHTADHFMKMAETVEMLGASCLVAGVQPAVSSTLASLETDLDRIRTCVDCAEALALCQREIAVAQAARQSARVARK